MTEKAKQIISVYVQNVVNDSKSQFENVLSITSDEKALQKTLLRLRTDTLKN